MFTQSKVEIIHALLVMKLAKFLVQLISLSKVCLLQLHALILGMHPHILDYIYLTLTFLLLIEPAKFVKKLNDVKVEKGKQFILECTFTGTAPIGVSWRKNGINVTQSEKCHITTTETSAILEMSSSKQDDAGLYSCHIENESGQDNSQAAVSILGL